MHHIMKDDNYILRPKITQTILLIIICFTFVVLGIVLNDLENIKLLMVLVFFGLGLVIFIIQLIPGSTQLTLSTNGFLITSLFRSHFIKWSDVKIFRIGYLHRSQAVMFDFIESDNKDKSRKSIAKALTKGHGALPNNYGLSAMDLLDKMNEWKNKYCE